MAVRQHRQYSGRQGLALAAPGPQMSQQPSQPSQLPTGWASQVAIMPNAATSCCPSHGGAHHVCNHALSLSIPMPTPAGCTRRHLHATALSCNGTAETCLRSLPPNPVLLPASTCSNAAACGAAGTAADICQAVGSALVAAQHWPQALHWLDRAGDTGLVLRAAQSALEHVHVMDDVQGMLPSPTKQRLG